MLEWFGDRGLGWKQLRGRFNDRVSRRAPPDVLVLHAGGNDLGCIPARALISRMKGDIKAICREYPFMLLVWSEIVPRYHWRSARDPKAINRTRIKVNRAVSKLVLALGGLVIRHVDLEWEADFFREDGIHLNALGLDLFNLNLQGRIEEGIEVWRSGQP